MYVKRSIKIYEIYDRPTGYSVFAVWKHDVDVCQSVQKDQE